MPWVEVSIGVARADAAVAEQALEVLRPCGLLALEVGHESGQAARRLLEGLGYVGVDLTPDLGGSASTVEMGEAIREQIRRAG